MKSKPVGRFENTLTGRLMKSKPAVILANWIFQGMRYMSFHEVVVKILLDIIFTAIFMAMMPISIENTVIAVILAHTINWIINGHFYVLMRYVYPIKTSRAKFERYIKRLQKKAYQWKCIDSLSIYGSYSRDMLHEYSDLDVRVITSNTLAGGFCGAVFCLVRRFEAFVFAFPLDIYSFNDLKYLDRLRKDERPVILKDTDGMLERYIG